MVRSFNAMVILMLAIDRDQNDILGRYEQNIGLESSRFPSPDILPLARKAAILRCVPQMGTWLVSLCLPMHLVDERMAQRRRTLPFHNDLLRNRNSCPFLGGNG